MIPTLGVMVGAYIFARLLEMITSTSSNIVVRVVGVLALIVTIICTLDLFMQGMRPSPGMIR